MLFHLLCVLLLLGLSSKQTEGLRLLGGHLVTPLPRRVATFEPIKVIRGGSFGVAHSASTLGGVCSGLSIANGLSLVLAPEKSFQSLYDVDLSGDSFLAYLVQAIGAIVIGVGFLTYCTIVSKDVSVTRALGLSLLPRLKFSFIIFHYL